MRCEPHGQGKKLENVRMRKWENLEISKLTWVRRKKSVACATEILQIFKKNQTNRLQIVWKSRTDYTDCTDSLSFDNWQLIIDKCDGHELATALLDFTDYNINTIVNQYWYI